MQNDDDLKRKLETWQVRGEVSPRFQAGVWERIAARNIEMMKQRLIEPGISHEAVISELQK